MADLLTQRASLLASQALLRSALVWRTDLLESFRSDVSWSFAPGSPVSTYFDEAGIDIQTFLPPLDPKAPVPMPRFKRPYNRRMSLAAPPPFRPPERVHLAVESEPERTDPSAPPTHPRYETSNTSSPSRRAKKRTGKKAPGSTPTADRVSSRRERLDQEMRRTGRTPESPGTRRDTPQPPQPTDRHETRESRRVHEPTSDPTRDTHHTSNRRVTDTPQKAGIRRQGPTETSLKESPTRATRSSNLIETTSPDKGSPLSESTDPRSPEQAPRVRVEGAPTRPPVRLPRPRKSGTTSDRGGAASDRGVRELADSSAPTEAPVGETPTDGEERPFDEVERSETTPSPSMSTGSYARDTTHIRRERLDAPVEQPVSTPVEMRGTRGVGLETASPDESRHRVDESRFEPDLLTLSVAVTDALLAAFLTTDPESEPPTAQPSHLSSSLLSRERSFAVSEGTLVAGGPTASSLRSTSRAVVQVSTPEEQIHLEASENDPEPTKTGSSTPRFASRLRRLREKAESMRPKNILARRIRSMEQRIRDNVRRKDRSTSGSSSQNNEGTRASQRSERVDDNLHLPKTSPRARNDGQPSGAPTAHSRPARVDASKHRSYTPTTAPSSRSSDATARSSHTAKGDVSSRIDDGMPSESTSAQVIPGLAGTTTRTRLNPSSSSPTRLARTSSTERPTSSSTERPTSSSTELPTASSTELSKSPIEAGTTTSSTNRSQERDTDVPTDITNTTVAPERPSEEPTVKEILTRLAQLTGNGPTGSSPLRLGTLLNTANGEELAILKAIERQLVHASSTEIPVHLTGSDGTRDEEHIELSPREVKERATIERYRSDRTKGLSKREQREEQEEMELLAKTDIGRDLLLDEQKARKRDPGAPLTDKEKSDRAKELRRISRAQKQYGLSDIELKALPDLQPRLDNEPLRRKLVPKAGSGRLHAPGGAPISVHGSVEQVDLDSAHFGGEANSPHSYAAGNPLARPRARRQTPEVSFRKWRQRTGRSLFTRVQTAVTGSQRAASPGRTPKRSAGRPTTITSGDVEQVHLSAPTSPQDSNPQDSQTSGVTTPSSRIGTKGPSLASSRSGTGRDASAANRSSNNQKKKKKGFSWKAPQSLVQAGRRALGRTLQERASKVSAENRERKEQERRERALRETMELQDDVLLNTLKTLVSQSNEAMELLERLHRELAELDEIEDLRR